MKAVRVQQFLDPVFRLSIEGDYPKRKIVDETDTAKVMFFYPYG